jgi:hypothetical protein
VQKIGGEREVKKQQQSIVKGGGRVAASWGGGGGGRGMVALLSSLSSSRQDGQREGSGDNFDDCGGGEVASWLSSRGMGKEKDGMGAASDGERGGGHAVVVSFGRLDLAVKHPIPSRAC